MAVRSTFLHFSFTLTPWWRREEKKWRRIDDWMRGQREKIPRKKWDRNKIEGWFKVFHTKYAYVAIFLVLRTHAHIHSPLSHNIIVIFFLLFRSSVWVCALLHIHFAATQNVSAFFYVFRNHHMIRARLSSSFFHVHSVFFSSLHSLLSFIRLRARDLFRTHTRWSTRNHDNSMNENFNFRNNFVIFS